MPHYTPMARLTVTLDGIHGTVKLLIEGGQGDRQQLELKWCKFDDEGYRTGFMASFMDHPIVVTERAAEQFLRTIVTSLMGSLDISPSDISIVNHLGERLHDIEFLPPTFEGNEVDILEFVALQDSIKKMYAVYEQTGDLSSEYVEACADEGILDDILSLVQIRASGFVLSVRKPTNEE